MTAAFATAPRRATWPSYARSRLNIVGRDKTTKASVRARRKKAAWNDAYMLKLLAG